MSSPVSTHYSQHSLLIGGRHISAAAADQAAEWLTLLMSGEATPEDKLQWQRWRESDPDNECAWQHIESVTGWLENMQAQVTYGALSPYAQSKGPISAGRRKTIALLSGAVVLLGSGALASRTNMWQLATADYRTARGEQRSMTLDDGTVVTLNTASAIDVRFDEYTRVVHLLSGEIALMTRHAVSGQASDPRPLYVQTAEGRIRSLGTHFSVRQWQGHTTVAVLQSAVEVVPAQSPTTHIIVKQGQSLLFTSRDVAGEPAPMEEQQLAWFKGQIIADNMRLGNFMEELARYLPGIVRCEPEAADLRFSGVFPLNDIPGILTALPSVLPVRVRSRTRYWVSIEIAA